MMRQAAEAGSKVAMDDLGVLAERNHRPDRAKELGAYLGEVILRATDSGQWAYISEYGDVAVEIPQAGCRGDGDHHVFPPAFVSKRLTSDTTASLREYAATAMSGDFPRPA